MLNTLLLTALVGINSPLSDGIKYTALTGCNNTAINVAASCEFRVVFGAFSTKLATHNYHTLAVYMFFDRDGATGYTFQAQSCIEGMDDTDCTDSTDWYDIDAQTASNQYTDIEPKVYRRTVSADSRDVFFLGAMYPRVRISNILCTGGGCTANDKITAQVILHVEPLGFLP